MNVLLACECSGVVRDAFAALGHNAWSCDIKPSETPGQHMTCDVREVLTWDYWDMMIAFPPCTYVTYAGARWWKREGWRAEQVKALDFFRELLTCDIPKIAIENPRGLPMTEIRWPDDVVQPYEFGDSYEKRTYLWLKNLPPLMRTYVQTEYERGWTESRSKDKKVARSRFSHGIAMAMAAQWGCF